MIHLKKEKRKQHLNHVRRTACLTLSVQPPASFGPSHAWKDDGVRRERGREALSGGEAGGQNLLSLNSSLDNTKPRPDFPSDATDIFRRRMK